MGGRVQDGHGELPVTRKKALMILIDHAAQNCQGVGCGIRTLPSETERMRVAQAVLKVWPQKYFQPNWGNMGLPEPVAGPDDRPKTRNKG